MIDFLLLSIIILFLFTVFVVYLGYPLALAFLPNKMLNQKINFDEHTVVYHIIPMYNERQVAKDKILNSLRIISPHKIVTVIVIDESNDGTEEIVSQYYKKFPNQIMLINKGYRKGKNDSINKAIEFIVPKSNDILFFSDGNTMFESDSFQFLYEKLSRGYGLVGGSMQYFDEKSETAKSEGLYWKYEEWIRRNEAKVGRCIVVNGGNFAMLSKYFKFLPTFVPNDLEAPLRLCGTGVAVGFSYESKGIELAVLDENEEMSRKKRMGNRQMNCIKYLWPELNFLTKIQIILRKVLRWSGLHLLLLSLVTCIILSALYSFHSYQLLALFALLGLIAIFGVEVLIKMRVKSKFLKTIHHAVKVHVFSFSGMMSSVFGKKVSTWNKAESNR
jgi:biofilm PGA synthesis N-glycosyltransferase PgaC